MRRLLACSVAVVAIAAGCHGHGRHWLIAGTVRLADGSPLAGVAVRIEWPELGGLRVETTRADGTWQWDWDQSFGSLGPQQRFVVTAQRDGYSFAPASYSFDVPSGDYRGIDFTATPQPASSWIVEWIAWDAGGRPAQR